jgi:glycyl-tRNA synthetase beta chain
MSVPFLLEIGTEEIPDWMIKSALEDLGAHFTKLGVTHENLRLDATPRRLVLRADNLPEKQADSEERVVGPSKAAPEQAVAGFARKQGIRPEDLEVEATAKGEYWAFTRKVEGRRTIDILADALPRIILQLYFPKTMYWTGKGGARFIRPIRWLVALLGEQIVPFELAGVRSGAITSGHRRLGSKEIVVTCATYEQRLRDHFVILSATERRAKIEKELEGVRIKPDAGLLETLTYLTEWPAPIVGDFDPQFLSLPEEVLITVMKHHQKNFSVEKEDGSLAPQFVAVMNIDADREGYVKSGNERVLRARFNDARFFWDTDQKRPLEERFKDLAKVVFQAKLGTYQQKTKRVMALVKELGGKKHAVRAAKLAKCDLPTELVKEFTELQGVVGGLYARAQGEPEEVWQAVYDHYKPVNMEDSIPRNRAGQLVSLADKLDTLRGCFGIGMVPTGSKDPFALRRAAQGVVKILVEGRHQLLLPTLIGDNPQLREFLADRVRFYFKDYRGFAYDEVSAAMAAGWDNLVDLGARLERIQKLRLTPDFEPLAASFKRIKNILRQAEFTGTDSIDEGLVEAGPERELYDEFRALAGQPIESAIARLRPKVDLFFDKVLVNAPDARIRQNRLTLLNHLLAEFSNIADFSEIVTAS